MPKLLIRYRKIFALILTTIILLWCINNYTKPRETMSYPQKVIGFVVVPFQKAFNFVAVQINDTYTFFNEIGTLKEENKKLSIELQALKDEKRQIKTLQTENERLRNMLGLKQEYAKYELESAEVIGRNSEKWNSVVIINKGSKHGITVNSQVISHNKGLIGRIIDVGPDWSKVMLITDADSSVSSMIESTRELTVVRGDPIATKNGYIKLTYVMPDTQISTNDTIITSGYGGIFTKGILIGKVVEIKNEPNELTKYALIEPTADFKRLEEVLVIKSIKD